MRQHVPGKCGVDLRSRCRNVIRVHFGANIPAGGHVSIVHLLGIKIRIRHDDGVVGGQRRGIARSKVVVEGCDSPVDAVDCPVVSDEQVVKGPCGDSGILRCGDSGPKVFPPEKAVVRPGVGGNCCVD